MRRAAPARPDGRTAPPLSRAGALRFALGRAGALRFALAAATLVSGCAEIDRAIQPPAVNPASPIAGYAEDVSRRSFPTPRFNQVPPKPSDVRPPAAYRNAVIREVAFRRELAAWRRAHPDLNSDTEAWADLQRHRIPKGAATPVSVAHDAEAEAFARRLREEAGKPSP